MPPAVLALYGGLVGRSYRINSIENHYYHLLCSSRVQSGKDGQPLNLVRCEVPYDGHLSSGIARRDRETPGPKQAHFAMDSSPAV
ncbi:hypothetical protein D3C76_698180 [compost metagenome]